MAGAGARVASRAGVLALALLWIDASSAQMLEFVDSEGRVLAAYPLQAEDRWCLLWNHSVARFTVRDCFVYRPPAIVLEYSDQPDFAAGLGHVEGRGTVRADGRGGYRIEHIDEPLRDNQLLLRVGSRAVNHRIEFRGVELSLSDLEANQRVVMRLGACDAQFGWR